MIRVISKDELEVATDRIKDEIKILSKFTNNNAYYAMHALQWALGVIERETGR